MAPCADISGGRKVDVPLLNNQKYTATCLFEIGDQIKTKRTKVFFLNFLEIVKICKFA